MSKMGLNNYFCEENAIFPEIAHMGAPSRKQSGDIKVLPFLGCNGPKIALFWRFLTFSAFIQSVRFI